MTSLSGSLSLPDTTIPGNAAGAECASQHKVIISRFSSCEMHYQQKNHYMNDSCLAGIWHYPQQTLCSKLVRVRMKTVLPLLLTDLTLAVVSQPAASALQTFTLHVPASWLRVRVQCTIVCQVEDVLSARTFVYESAALPLKISLGCCQAVDWGTSLTLLPTPAGESPRLSSWALLPHCPVVLCVVASL